VQKRKTAGVRGVNPVGEKVGENNLSNAWIVTKRKKLMLKILHRMKERFI